ncbi:hypothetical protein NSS79_23320 [Paenibacillus sp. FSL L8-0436]|uniref:hypothetical protein n=1 Tax=Paenibacillus sp. FSL L8-0436 TaxID=2954686 RepID=UPI003158E8FB
MLDSVLFIVFSVLESTSLFYLAFKIFKIDLYPKEIVFAGLIMAFFSYCLRFNYSMSKTDVFLQYTLAFLFIWLLFRIHIFYAVIMTGMTYQAYMLIQSLLYLFMNLTGLVKMNFPSLSTGSYLLQLLTVTASLIIAYYIGKKRKGFDFVPDKPEGRIDIGKRDKILFALSIPSVLLVILMLYLVEYLPNLFFLIPLLYGMLLFGYLYYSSQKNRGDEF